MSTNPNKNRKQKKKKKKQETQEKVKHKSHKSLDKKDPVKESVAMLSPIFECVCAAKMAVH